MLLPSRDRTSQNWSRNARAQPRHPSAMSPGRLVYQTNHPADERVILQTTAPSCARGDTVPVPRLRSSRSSHYLSATREMRL